CRGGRPPGSRGDRGGRTGAHAPARRRHAPGRAAAGRYRVPARAPARSRRGAGDVPRPGPAGAQVQRLRAGGEPDPRPALPAGGGRPRHRAGPGRHRPRRSFEPVRGALPLHPAGRAPRRATPVSGDATITWDDFMRVDLRVGRIVSARVFEQARKPAYVLEVDFGPEIGLRKSSAQVTALYTPEELVGRLVV